MLPSVAQLARFSMAALVHFSLTPFSPMEVPISSTLATVGGKRGGREQRQKTER
jgi:hypothetical protein